MFARNVSQNFVIAIALTAVCAGVYAEETVYKWVDEDGVVHFSDAPPDQANVAEAETLIIPRSPPVAAPAQPVAKPPVASAAKDEKQPSRPAREAAPAYQKIDITKMSLADLDLRCDEAREKAIAPLREAEIAKCKQNRRNDPAWCERFNADFGDGGRTVSGSIRPRMFDDLPQCVDALQERNRRGH